MIGRKTEEVGDRGTERNRERNIQGNGKRNR